ncbi:hypothetical protein [Halosimplex pelagicum]|uniref:Uncharacterized protein n=1 Tax=Halosimplex pelagicum TaxID=869886 RepID=A0A7D5PA86_9EURY|nr:hypothetical protein [Halosimplex pelagicum]QLH83221.1 hypothetical protein HZS54_16990 [Halosimplex pelagicum]
MPGNILSGLDFVGAFLMGFVLVLLVVLGRFLMAYARVRDRRDALSTATAITGRWALALILGGMSAVAVGLVQFGDIVGVAFGFIVGHPYFVTNFGILGIGAGGLSGLISISGQQFIGIGMLIVGVVFLSVEVDDAV